MKNHVGFMNHKEKTAIMEAKKDGTKATFTNSRVLTKTDISPPLREYHLDQIV